MVFVPFQGKEPTVWVKEEDVENFWLFVKNVLETIFLYVGAA